MRTFLDQLSANDQRNYDHTVSTDFQSIWYWNYNVLIKHNYHILFLFSFRLPFELKFLVVVEKNINLLEKNVGSYR